MSPDKAASRDPLAQIIDLWAGLFEHANAQCEAVMKGFEMFYGPRTLRDGCLENLNQAMHGYLRCPPFLEFIRNEPQHDDQCDRDP